MEQPLQVRRRAMTKIAVKLAPKGASGLTAAEDTCRCRGVFIVPSHWVDPPGSGTVWRVTRLLKYFNTIGRVAYIGGLVK